MIRSIIFLLLISSASYASPKGKNSFTLSGTTCSPDTVVIKLFQDYFPSEDDRYAGVYTALPVNGHFSIVIPGLLRPAYISLSLIPGQSTKSALYFIEPADKVTVSCRNNEIVFSGRSARKLQCQQELYKLSLQHYTPGDPTRMTDFTPYTRRQWQIRKADSLYLIRQNLIRNYKPFLSAVAFRQLQLDFLGDLYYAQYNQAYGNLYSSAGSVQQQEANAYKDYYLQKKLSVVGADPALSRSYSKFLLEKLKADIWVRNFFNAQTSRTSLKSLVAVVDAGYTGILKEKLMTAAFTELFDKNEDAATLLQQYLKGIIHKRYRQILVTILQQKKPGIPVKYFEFENTARDVVHLSDFRGRTVVLNIWISTCHHCIVLAAQMKLLRDSIKALGNVVLVTVNVDKDRDKWLSSLEKGIFTEKDNINLFTAGQGIDHPFMKYYNYVAMPAQMIIDKDGRLVTLYPSRPLEPLSAAKFLQQVKSAL
jgi:peroxiredoxin